MSNLYLTVATAAEGGHEASDLQLFFFHSLSEVIVTSLASIIVFALLWWKGAPAARTALAKRTDSIAAELSDAEKARTDGEAKLVEVRQRIADAEDERQRILVEARQTAEALKQQILARAEADAEALKTRAAADTESAKTQAIADLQAEAAALALGAAEAVVARNLDAQTQAGLIDGYIEQLGAAPAAESGGYVR
jgi:F-type H+-transporting ATPase subunit b